MNLKEYKELALITKAPTQSFTEDMVHAAFGLVTEIAEIADQYKRHRFYNKALDTTNIKEEIGDTMWYVAIACYALDIEIPEPGNVKNVDPYKLLVELTGFASFIFGTVFKDPAGIQLLEYDVTMVVTHLSNLCKLHDYSLEQACADNIEKLRKRYPKGFSEHSAINRDKANELSHITDAAASDAETKEEVNYG